MAERDQKGVSEMNRSPLEDASPTIGRSGSHRGWIGSSEIGTRWPKCECASSVPGLCVIDCGSLGGLAGPIRTSVPE
jgi:hypothetical protein